jgi:hypothetical protein
MKPPKGIPEQAVAQAVAEVSVGADHPQHVASVVGAFMRRQRMIGHYVQSHLNEISAEGTVLLLLHASVLARSVEIARGRPLRELGARELDVAARRAPKDNAKLAEEEPELIGYLEGNLTADDPTLGGARRARAMELLRVITRALLDER